VYRRAAMLLLLLLIASQFSHAVTPTQLVAVSIHQIYSTIHAVLSEVKAGQTFRVAKSNAPTALLFCEQNAG